MERLKLSEKGRQFVKYYRAAFNFLEVGGRIKTKDGMTLAMSEDGDIMFVVTQYKGSDLSNGEEKLMGFGDESVALSHLMAHVRHEMTDEDWVGYASSSVITRLKLKENV